MALDEDEGSGWLLFTNRDCRQQPGIDCANKGEWIMIQLSSGLRCKSAYFVGKYIPHPSKEGNQSKFNQVGGLLACLFLCSGQNQSSQIRLYWLFPNLTEYQIATNPKDYKIQNTKHKIQNMQNAKYKIQKMQNAKHKMLNITYNSKYNRRLFP